MATNTLKSGTSELNQTLDRVRDGVNMLTNRTITETEFRNTLLQLAIAFHSGESVDLGHWVHYAGSVYSGVVVVDDNTHEQILHTPGIITSADLAIESGLHEIIAEAGYNQSRSMSADRIYAEGLARGSVLQMDNGARHILGWYEIFSRYNLRMVMTNSDDLPVSDAANAVSEVQQPTVNTNVDWGDGDLA